MRALITDPHALPALMRDYADAFDVLCYQLQEDDTLDDARVDAWVARVAEPIVRAIDCTQCGNCCKALDVYLEEADVERLSSGIVISFEDVMTHYVDTEVAHTVGEWGKFARKPCAFLSGTRCSVYAHRPQTCRDYPAFNPDFRWLLDDIIDGASICPIIANVLLALLDEVDDFIAGRIAP
jgi:hypothetical protein